MRYLITIVTLAWLVGVVTLDSTAMAKCEELHSSLTCNQQINR